MFCINCGKENNEGMKFCTHCGSKLSVDNSLNKEMSVSNVDNRKNDHKNLIIVMIIAIATILIGIGALVLWKVNHNRETYNNIVDYNSNQRIDNNSNSIQMDELSKTRTQNLNLNSDSNNDKDYLYESGKKGKVFYGCNRYPDCDFVSWNEPTNEDCPNCHEGRLEIIHRGRGTAHVCPKCAFSRTIESGDDDHTSNA